MVKISALILLTAFRLLVLATVNAASGDLDPVSDRTDRLALLSERSLSHTMSMPQVSRLARDSDRALGHRGTQTFHLGRCGPATTGNESGGVRRRFRMTQSPAIGTPSSMLSKAKNAAAEALDVLRLKRSVTSAVSIQPELAEAEDSIVVDCDRAALLSSLDKACPNVLLDEDIEAKNVGRLRAALRRATAHVSRAVSSICRRFQKDDEEESSGPRCDNEAKWAQKSAEEVIAELSTDTTNGLALAQVRQLQESGVLNVLDPPQITSLLEILWDAVNNGMVYLMIGGFIALMATQKYIEGVSMAVFLSLLLSVGTVPSWNAARLASKLSKETPTEVQVLRQSQWTTVLSTDLVPGDVIMLQAGCRVPADCRVVEAQDFRVTEAELTGESEPLEKVVDVQNRIGDGGTYSNLILMGTSVNAGQCTAVVVETGMRARYGSIQSLLIMKLQKQTPIMAKVDRLVVKFTRACIGVASGLGLLNLALGRKPNPESNESNLLQSFRLSLSLCIAVIPEGLPISCALSLYKGMQRMLDHANARVRTMSAVECLSAVDVFCSDKTGTLTTNQMTVVGLYLPGIALDLEAESDASRYRRLRDRPEPNNPIRRVQMIGAICNCAVRQMDGSFIGQPTEVALANLSPDMMGDEINYVKVKTNTFDSGRKMMSVVVKSTDTLHDLFPSDDPHSPYIALVKGAPEKVIDLCTLMVDQFGDHHRIAVDAQKALAQQLSAKGSRVLALAYRPVASGEDLDAASIESALIFAGLVEIKDPLRGDVPGTVDRLHQAGIRVKMITGDSLETARAIAEQAHIVGPGTGDGGAVHCADLRRLRAQVDVLKFQHLLCRYGRDPSLPNSLQAQIDRQLVGVDREALPAALAMQQDALDRMVQETLVFARALPEDKVTIVEALQRHGRIVAMTGDGVNDAPALKKADAGIAVCDATDLTKRAAPINLLDDDFAHVADLIAQGRLVAHNMVKAVFCMFSANVGELGPFFGQPFGLPAALRMLQVLWLNAFTDVFNIVPFANDDSFTDLMQEDPIPVTAPILQTALWFQVVIINLLTTIGSLFLQLFALKRLTGFLLGNVPDRHAESAIRAYGVSSTAVMLFMVLSQLLFSYTCRDLTNTMIGTQFFTNRSMHVAVIVSAVLSLGVPYVPKLNGWLTMSPVPFTYVAMAVGLSLILPVGHELLKGVYRLFRIGQKGAGITVQDAENPFPSAPSTVQLHEIEVDPESAP